MHGKYCGHWKHTMQPLPSMFFPGHYWTLFLISSCDFLHKINRDIHQLPKPRGEIWLWMGGLGKHCAPSNYQKMGEKKQKNWPGTMVQKNNSHKKNKVKRGGGGCRGAPIDQFSLTCSKHTTNMQNSRAKLANRQRIIERDKNITTLMLCVQSLNPKPV